MEATVEEGGKTSECTMTAGPKHPQKVVLAYSGGLDTSVAIKWIQEKYVLEIVTLTVDVGQGDDFETIEQNAYANGAVKHYTLDAKQEFIEQYPRSKLVRQVKLQIGKLCLGQGDTQKAKQVFSEIISDYTQEIELCANARALLAGCYEKEGNAQQAAEEYTRLRKDYPDTRLALAAPYFIARNYLISKTEQDKAEASFKQAISEYRQIIDREGDISQKMEAGKLINLCYIQQQKWDEAIDSLYELIDKFPNRPEAQLFLFNIAGIYQRELDNPEKAIGIYEELISKYPANQVLITQAKMRLQALQASRQEEIKIEN